jgi:putative phage-type endonuclease
MDSVIDRVYNYYVIKHSKTIKHNIEDVINFIYDNVSISVDDNISIEYIYKRLLKIKEYKLKLEKIKTIPIIVQRSSEWFKVRNNLITASDIGQALNHGDYGNQKEFLIKKITGKSKEITFRAPLEWGVKYEDVATAIYSKRNKIKVFEFGLIEHPNIHYFGASPDGISELGIMLEIKCPYKRKINGKILEQYYDQIQGQLEVCDLDECDFLECEFQEYKNEKEFLNDKDELKEKGIIICYRSNIEDDYKYIYSSINNKNEDIVKWKDDKLSEFDITIDFKVNYWKIRKYNNQRVYRDKELFNTYNQNLKIIWDKILYYRNPDNKNNFVKEILNNKKQKGRIYDFKSYPNELIINGFAIKNVKNDNDC